MWSANRAAACASATIDALILVDNVLSVAFADSFYRAVSCACTTSDASITNYICHISSSLCNKDMIV